MKHLHRLSTVLIMLSMILGLFSMPAFSGNAALARQADQAPLAQTVDAQSTSGPTPPSESKHLR